MKGQSAILIALFAAVLCVCGPWALPVGPVPITLASFAVYVAAGLLGAKRATAAVGLYLLLGFWGVPVFAGFSGGAHRLFSPGGGYLIGYLLCALLAGWLTSRRQSIGALIVALTLGTLALYAVGVPWLLVQTKLPLPAALLYSVLPCLPGDVLKIAAATALIPLLRAKLAALPTDKNRKA